MRGLRLGRVFGSVMVAALAGLFGADAVAVESTCHGTVAAGRLENGISLPGQGPNFVAYSSLGAGLGRTHVHSTVAQIVTDAYQALEHSAPGKVFVYGETGWASGGRFRPHRTHRNGLSVDFMVPVMDPKGSSIALPTGPGNKWGYDLEFDANGRSGELAIDFEAMGEHLYQLDRAARARGKRIARAIFDPPYLPRLFATKRGEYLKAHIPFMKGQAWIRHDEHYHVDFLVPCRPM